MSRFPSNIRFDYRGCHPSNFTSGTWRKDFIVLHWWGDPATKPQFGGVVSWFQNPSANVSIQYMVESGRVTQMIPESAMAWHAGNSTANRHGIGIEVNPRLSSGDYEATAQLVAEIWRRRGRLPLRRHREFFGTSCPGTMDVNRIQRRAEQIYTGKGSTAPAVTTPSKEKKPMSLTQANIQSIADAVWRYTGRDFVNENSQFKDTQIARAYQHAQQARNETREVKAMVKAQAKTLDKVLKSNGEILKAVESAEREVIKANAEDVAAELKIGVKDSEEK